MDSGREGGCLETRKGIRKTDSIGREFTHCYKPPYDILTYSK